MPELHQRGIELLVNVLDAADHAEELSTQELRQLLKEVAEVVSQMLEREAQRKLKSPSGN